MVPGVCEKRSHTDSPLPSSFQAPSIWYAAVAVPQKKFLGNTISDESATCRATLDAPKPEDTAPALDETLHPEKKPTGSAAARPAPRADCTNSRRVRRKIKPGSF